MLENRKKTKNIRNQKNTNFGKEDGPVAVTKR